MTRIPLIVANWKMNHGVAESIKFITEFSKAAVPDFVDVVICPPFTSLYMMNVALTDVKKVILGAQNCHYEDSGAFTGEVSCDFLKEINCQYVIIGHSERRLLFKEDNDVLKKKLGRVLDKDLNPIYCVGETLPQREAGKTLEVVGLQLESVLRTIGSEAASRVVIAYEPIWAIGTGKHALPAQAQEVHVFIRDWVCDQFGLAVANNMRILYGGSVKSVNIKQLMAEKDIDGALVGNASLNSDEFFRIILGAREFL